MPSTKWIFMSLGALLFFVASFCSFVHSVEQDWTNLEAQIRGLVGNWPPEMVASAVNQAKAAAKEYEAKTNADYLKKYNETVAQRRARLCSASLSPLVPEMLEKSPPFAIYQYGGKGEENFWEALFPLVAPCHIGLMAKVVPNSHCMTLAGFVDHLFPTGPPAGTLITELDGPKLDGQPAVVRLLCAANALKFMESVGGIQQLPSEEIFLKTLFALEFGWFPGCIVVFFDTRTLDPERHPMGRLLLQQGPALKRGTKDRANPWAASKFICGQPATHAFSTELQRMRFRNRDAPKELGKWEDQVREQLAQKIEEEMFPVVQVTAPPARGFFARLFDRLLG